MGNLSHESIQCIGYDVAADVYEAESDVVLLNLIGYSSNKQKYKEFLSFISENSNYTVVTFDYTGHGESPYRLEDIRPAQHFLEVITAFDWISEKYPDSKIYIMGASYGGYLATQLTKYRNFEKLILRVPALFTPEIFYTPWGLINHDLEKHYRESGEKLSEHPLLKRASSFNGKCLVITHELDTICPSNSTQPFIDAFQAEHWEASGLKHSFGESNMSDEQKNSYYKKVVDWLA